MKHWTKRLRTSKESLNDVPKKAKAIANRLKNAYEEKLRRLARKDINAFCEYVIKDEKSNKILQEKIHEEIQWHINECYKQNRKCGILAPWGHGKTENVIIARTLDFLGKDNNLRIFIVCNTDNNASTRVDAISNYIKHDPDYLKIYPDVKEGRTWSKHKLMIKRSSMAKDGSVEAWGITTSGTGGRCDILFFDDPVDLNNAILNPALRKHVKESFKNVWLPRLSDTGFMIYIATIWHNDDLTSDLLKNTAYCFLTIKVGETFDNLICESPLKGKWAIPLWSKWNKEKLKQRMKEIGTRAFNRGFRQKAITDEDLTFPSYRKIFLNPGVSVNDIVDKDWPRYTGIDPFGQWIVIFTIAKAPTGKRYVIEIRRGKWTPTETITQIIEVNTNHKPQIFMLENNAAQVAIEEWAKEKAGADLPLKAFTTGKQKADPTVGLPSLEVEFENGSWVCAVGPVEHEPDCECSICEFRKELGAHPIHPTADIIMAMWFAREAAKSELSDKYDMPKPSGGRQITGNSNRRIF